MIHYTLYKNVSSKIPEINFGIISLLLVIGFCGCGADVARDAKKSHFFHSFDVQWNSENAYMFYSLFMHV